MRECCVTAKRKASSFAEKKLKNCVQFMMCTCDTITGSNVSLFVQLLLIFVLVSSSGRRKTMSDEGQSINELIWMARLPRTRATILPARFPNQFKACDIAL